ncbi:MAG: MAPEG family protein [Candidatus Binataceae bacterium]
MNGVAAVMGLALIEYFVLGGLVGRARGIYHVAAPATTGDPIFERYFRVHQNTLESLIIFIPALWLFATYASISIAIALGLIFIAVRIIYAVGYIKDPEKRAVGAGLSFLVNAILVLGGLAGIAWRTL